MSLPQELKDTIQSNSFKWMDQMHLHDNEDIKSAMEKGAEIALEWIAQQQQKPIGYYCEKVSPRFISAEKYETLYSATKLFYTPVFISSPIPEPLTEKEDKAVTLAEALKEARKHIIWLDDLIGWNETAQQKYGQRNKNAFEVDFYNNSMNIGTLIDEALSDYNLKTQGK